MSPNVPRCPLFRETFINNLPKRGDIRSTPFRPAASSPTPLLLSFLLVLILVLVLVLVLPPLSQRAPRLRFVRAKMGRWKNRSTFRISRLNLRLPRRYLAKSLARCGLTFRPVSENDFTIQCREYPYGQWQGSAGRPYVHRSSHWKPGNCCRSPFIQRS